VRLVSALAASSLLSAALACGGGDLGLPGGPAPAKITVMGGNGQVGEVGTELDDSLVVRVDDDQNQPIAGVRVAFSLGAGADGGNTAPDTALTDADGEAFSRWVLGGIEGRQQVIAEVVGQDLVANFSAQAERNSTLTLEGVSGNGQSAEPGSELGNPLVVRLVDEEGNGVAGQAVAWVVATGGGTASPETSDTDDEGFASTRWTLGDSPGDNTLNAVVSGVGVVKFTATGGDGGSGPSAELSTISAVPASIAAGTEQSTITVTVRDGQGAPIAGAAVTLSATGGGNLLTQPPGPTGDDGVATGTLRSVVPGTKVVGAVVNGTVELAQTAEVVVTLVPPEPDHLVFRVQPTNTGQNEAISPPVEVALVDADGEIVPLSGVQIEIEFLRSNDNDHRFDGEPIRTTVDGIAVFPDLSNSHTHDDFHLRASAPERPELGSVESSTFAVED
jgi:Bacterial Ig-like domain (group 1)